ncbi:MAG: SpoIIE family protein phosphatase [Phycisphaerales bacterium]|nr:SpoIIE family protein phosphatase [Phycisphaerales bacterium]
MSLRWKLLALLVVLTLVPLIIAMWYTLFDLRRSGQGIAKELRKELTTSAEQHLSELATSLAQEVHLDIGMIDMTLMTWSEAVSQEWDKSDSTVESDSDLPSYYADDVRNGVVVPEDMAADPRYSELSESGEKTNQVVITDAPVFYVPLGLARSEVDLEVSRLKNAFWTLRIATAANVNLAHRYILSLENGLFMNFPGHIDLPKDYNPVERPWYQLGKKSKGVSRTYPYIDASNGKLVSSFTYPIKLTDGTILGVVACDVVLTEFFASLSIPPEWQEYASIMVVNPVKDKVIGDRLEIVAKKSAVLESINDEIKIQKPTYINPDQSPGIPEVIRQMRLSQSGKGKIDIGGEELLWAYAPMTDSGPFLLLEVPANIVASKANEIQSWLVDEVSRHAWRNIVFLVFLMIIVVVLAFLCARSVTRPISNLVSVAKKIAVGDLEARASVATSDEVGELAAVFNDMVPKLRDRMRIREALGVAMEVQQNLLPSEPPQLSGFDIAGRSVYCDETGGDYYDFLELKELGEGILGIAVGDVTGHGIAAALLMATARGALRVRLAAPGSLAEVMGQVNTRLAQDTQSGRFMTLFFLVINKQLGEMRWVSAGHDPMLRFSPETDSFDELGGSDIPLGIDGEWVFTEASESGWKPGQIIVIGTDGIWESRNSDGEMFGKDRLRDVIRSQVESSADQIAIAITTQLDEFRGQHNQEDDVTLVVIKVM